MVAGRAVLAAEEDDLEMTAVPRLAREHRFQIAFSVFDAGAPTQTPAGAQAMNMGVDRKCRMSECL
jgi:hypothetical protein